MALIIYCPIAGLNSWAAEENRGVGLTSEIAFWSIFVTHLLAWDADTIRFSLEC